MKPTALKVIDENILADTKVAIGVRVCQILGEESMNPEQTAWAQKYRPGIFSECVPPKIDCDGSGGSWV